VKSKNI
jgi:hypothetical protein